jgi:hypothetical protein
MFVDAATDARPTSEAGAAPDAPRSADAIVPLDTSSDGSSSESGTDAGRDDDSGDARTTADTSFSAPSGIGCGNPQSSCNTTVTVSE